MTDVTGQHPAFDMPVLTDYLACPKCGGRDLRVWVDAQVLVNVHEDGAGASVVQCYPWEVLVVACDNAECDEDELQETDKLRDLVVQVPDAYYLGGAM